MGGFKPLWLRQRIFSSTPWKVYTRPHRRGRGAWQYPVMNRGPTPNPTLPDVTPDVNPDATLPQTVVSDLGFPLSKQPAHLPQTSPGFVPMCVGTSVAAHSPLKGRRVWAEAHWKRRGMEERMSCAGRATRRTSTAWGWEGARRETRPLLTLRQTPPRISPSSNDMFLAGFTHTQPIRSQTRQRQWATQNPCKDCAFVPKKIKVTINLQKKIPGKYWPKLHFSKSKTFSARTQKINRKNTKKLFCEAQSPATARLDDAASATHLLPPRQLKELVGEDHHGGRRRGHWERESAFLWLCPAEATREFAEAD